MTLIVMLFLRPAFAVQPTRGVNGPSRPDHKGLPGPFDLNSAGRADLVKVPGISGDLADIIVLYRELKGPFRDIEHFYQVVNALEEEKVIFSRTLVVGSGSPGKTQAPDAAAAPKGRTDEAAGIPEAPRGPGSFRFCVISDSNSTYGAIQQGAGVNAAVRAIVDRLRPELVIHNGDMVAGQRKTLGLERLEAMWNQYFRSVADPLKAASIKLAPVGGNHDASAGYMDREVFVRRWSDEERVPRVDFISREKYPLYYSFDYKGASFVILGAVNGNMQAADVETTRKLIEGSTGKPIFIFNHVPFERFYPKYHGNLTPEAKLYDLFIEAGADLFFTGHYEVYFRGFYKSLPIVSTGVIAGVDRRLIGTDGPQGMSFVVVDVVASSVSRVFAVKGPRFDSRFDEGLLTESFGNYRRFDQRD